MLLKAWSIQRAEGMDDLTAQPQKFFGQFPSQRPPSMNTDTVPQATVRDLPRLDPGILP